MNLIVSIDEARKILGDEISSKLSDDEVTDLIVCLDEIAKSAIKNFKSKPVTPIESRT